MLQAAHAENIPGLGCLTVTDKLPSVGSKADVAAKTKSAVLHARNHASLTLTATSDVRTARMQILSRPRRPHRSGEWTAGSAVTFIVTLAATRSVTLAAREARMSRKSAYALKSRDPAFAVAWSAALNAHRRQPQGDKVEEVEGPPISLIQSRIDTTARSPAAARGRCEDDRRRDAFFARLADAHRKPLALDLDLLL